jgi:signal transduction histidine kinase
MPLFSLRSGRRRSALGRIADGILSSPDLASVTRLLTRDLPAALEAGGASLLLWDRRLEGFEGLAFDEGGRLVTTPPEGKGAGTPGTRWLLSDGHLVETAAGGPEGMLVPLLARSGLAGMLVLGAAPRRGRPVSDGEARLVSIIATRAALALENLAYQKELIESERLAALGTMAGMLVHDLRGPMTLIRGWAETLLAGDVPPAEAAARARVIVDAVDRLDRMTGETLDFARAAEKLVLRSVPLGLFLAELAAGIEAELPGLRVERDFDVAGAHRGTLDVDKIRRAVSNVAANARDAMGGEGSLRFSARVVAGEDETGDRLELLLADDGPGVPEAIRERVFEPFVTLGKKRGTGLGLAVARRFVEDHGGTLELAPTRDGARGAAFRFALPLAPPAAPGAHTGPAASDGAAQR